MRLGILLMCAGLLPAYGGKYAGLWLEVSKETVPPGGVAQIRITLTEPKPIIRTRLMLDFDEAIVDSVSNIGVFSENGEAVGTAIRAGGQIFVEVLSPTANLGTVEEIPLLGFSMRMRQDVPAGTTGGIRIRPESTFYKLTGEKWYVESNAPGSFTVGGDLSIDDVIPGGGMVPAGQLVRIVGRGFQPDSALKVDGEVVGTALFVSSNEIQWRTEKDLQLDQREISVANGDTVVQTVVAVLKGTQRTWSAYDLLAATSPLFSPRCARSSTVAVPDAADTAFNFAAVALQNPQDTQASVRLEVISNDGRSQGTVTISLMGRERFMRLLPELFPSAQFLAGATLKVDSDQPVQVLGMEGNLIEGTARPIIANMLDVNSTSFAPSR